MDASLLKRPSAIIPLTMSAAALTVIIGYVAMFGTARQADEGTAAHLWQAPHGRPGARDRVLCHQVAVD